MYQISLQPRSETEHWRSLAEYWHLSPGARQRLEWLIFYYTVGNRNALATASYFGISPKTVHKWKGRFNPRLIQSLEEKSRVPVKKRTWQVTLEQESQIAALRLRYLKYGKKKLKLLYQEYFGETVTTWKIERVVRCHQLYPDPEEHRKVVKRQRRNGRKSKLRIHELRKRGVSGVLWHIDTVTLWWYGQRRVIFTSIEDLTRLGFARVYTSSASSQAADFLRRLVYLSGETITVIHSDNGGEFAKNFETACQELAIQRVYSRARTPKDNPTLERFNWTIQDEWLSLSEVGLDEIAEANQDLTEWLIEYNFHRPHQSLDYQTPVAYALANFPKVLPKTPASTSI